MSGCRDTTLHAPHSEGSGGGAWAAGGLGWPQTSSLSTQTSSSRAGNELDLMTTCHPRPAISPDGEAEARGDPRLEQCRAFLPSSWSSWAAPSSCVVGDSQDARVPKRIQTTLEIRGANPRLTEPDVCNKNLNVSPWWRPWLSSDQLVSSLESWILFVAKPD